MQQHGLSSIMMALITSDCELNAFVPGADLTPFTPPDYDPSPAALSLVADPAYAKWAAALNKMWLA